ncbi:RING finger protein 207 isoform X2 [Chiloscyllium plagiosum]|uniref:RING finger protein 207 isoform X2 n=1 Tax=Chiloscyllium plagiosum TaxID=36176 RepID=UPI001CB7D4EC|nr:RING finger protein 207 isoform X2 [Chiloscyllium plagiosum]
MSGGIFSPLDNLYDLDNANCHPLVCHLCYEQYEHPCLLDCYHTFCATCLRGRASEGRLSCPLCGRLSIVKGTSGLPKVDRLLKFLVDSSADNEEIVQCANCDFECKKQDAAAMFYCNTCNQPLCSTCREDTHRAKMFARHEIVTLAKRTKALHKKCSLHEEPYIMFSTEKKSMLCINCFRDMQVESRAHCIDIETAYVQGCEKLDQAVMAVKELQTSTREAIILLKAMINEVRANVIEEESAISSLFNSMQETLAERKKILLKTAQNQHEDKEKAFKEQLSNMAALLPTLQQLMERLQKIVKLPHRLRPTQSSKINTEYRPEFARCLEPLLFLNHRRSGSMTGGGPGTGISNGNGMNLVGTKTFPLSDSCASMGEMSLTNTVTCKPTSHRYISTKVLLAEGGHSPFTEHCRTYENTFKALQTELQSLKDQVQEMHRDLTKHHSLVKTDAIDEILQKSLQMETQISSQYSSVETMRTMFEEVWEETYQRVANEHEIYEAQLHDLMLLKQENTYLMTIARQISPYIRSIAKVKERLEPRLKEPRDAKDDRTDSMLKIYDESSIMTTDGQHRNDLTCPSEDKEKLTDNKDKVIDNRTLNILPADSELKSRELHRTKQKTGLDSSDRMELTL